MVRIKKRNRIALILPVLFLLACCTERTAPPLPADSGPPPSAPSGSLQAGESSADALSSWPKELTLVAVGDLMVHWDQVEDALQPDGSYDFTHSFEAVEADLAEGYAIGNLETVFGGPEGGYSGYPCFSAPDAVGEALKAAGFDFVSTCNNHSLDQGLPGALRTLEQLDRIGLAHTGTYATREDAQEITIVETGGMRIAILAFTFSTNGIPIPLDAPWAVNMLTEEKLIADLARARTLAPDLIVVMPHMGNEYETFTREVFLEWMDRMLYHGADIVLASHPHVLQPMYMRTLTDAQGRERQGFIICSLGNFISVQREEPRDAGMILKLNIVQNEGERPGIRRVSFVPTWVSYRDNTGRVNIRVVPVGDALADLKGDNRLALNGWDADRLRRANSDITALYLGEAVPAEETRREYIFYQAP